ncbi:APC family permease [Limosilactobacillus mucosae]|uniref:APC family permease n=1 Tax=Limosilactobacillus mucosae TaxID=97478 RepID=UPI0021E6EE20|nr:APC family permease [Limosilactobacillus mucosae]
MNSMVGSGIFLLPGVLFQDAGNWSLALILLAALSVLATAYCYAEMAHHFSGNGAGWYYTYKEFGRFWGFEIGLFTWLQGAAAIATEIAAFLRGLRPWLPRLSEITVYRWAGLGMILILLTIRLLGKKASTWANNFSTVLELAVLGLFVVLGIFYVKPGNFNASVHNSLSDFDHAFMLIFFMFPGFSFLPVQASSIHNSKKNLPKLLIGVVISVAVIYVITMGVAISMFYSTPYVASSLANEKALLPRFIGIKSQNGVPYVATLLTAGIVLILVMTGDYLALIPCSIMIAVVQYAFVAMATIKLEFADLKRRHAQGKIDHIDIYEMVLAVIALLCCLFLARFVTPLAIEITAGIALIGVVSYLGQLIKRPPAGN